MKRPLPIAGAFFLLCFKVYQVWIIFLQMHVIDSMWFVKKMT